MLSLERKCEEIVIRGIVMAEKMKEVTGGLPLPPGLGLG